jgi:hypothetical protein
MMQPATAPRPGAGNLVATILLFALLLGAGLLAVVLSGFFVMGTDSCSVTDAGCNTDALFYAVVATWGGVALAVVGATVGTIVSGLRHRSTWLWPLIGLAVVLVSFVGGLVLVGQMGSRSP